GGRPTEEKVWAKIEIALVLVTIDDKGCREESAVLALYADHVNVHAFTIPRTRFRKTGEGTIHNSFMHSLLARGRLLYTHDDSIARLFESLADIGERDTRLQLLGAATSALPADSKEPQWLLARCHLHHSH